VTPGTTHQPLAGPAGPPSDRKGGCIISGPQMLIASVLSTNAAAAFETESDPVARVCFSQAVDVGPHGSETMAPWGKAPNLGLLRP